MKRLVEILLSLGGNLHRRRIHGTLGKVDALHAAEHLVIPGGVQMRVFTKGQGHMVADGGVHHVQHGFLDVQTVQYLTALGVDDLTLLVHDVVVFQHGLTGLEVAALHGGLSIFNGTWSASCSQWACPRPDRTSPSCSGCGRRRTSASDHPPERYRTGSRRGRPDDRHGHGADCRSGGIRGARCR